MGFAQLKPFIEFAIGEEPGGKSSPNGRLKTYAGSRRVSAAGGEEV